MRITSIVLLFCLFVWALSASPAVSEQSGREGGHGKLVVDNDKSGKGASSSSSEAIVTGRSDFKTRIDLEEFETMAFDAPGVRALKVVVDRRPEQGEPAVYFLDSKIYDLHFKFVEENCLVPRDQLNTIQLESWRSEERRFVFAQLARYQELGAEKLFVIELFEQDYASAKLIAEFVPLVADRVAFGPLAFKPNSLKQAAYRDELERAGIPVLANDTLRSGRLYQVIHAGKPAVGRLRIITEKDPLAVQSMLFNRSDILLLQVVPNDITRVAGIITTSPTTPLSHVAMRARTWNIPIVMLKEAASIAYQKGLEDNWVWLEVAEDGLPMLRAATEEEIALAEAARVAAKRAFRIPRADTASTDLADLYRLRESDVVRVGAKAAQLGEVAYLTQVLEPAVLEPILKAVEGDWLEDTLGPLPGNPSKSSPRKLARSYLGKLHVPPGFAIPFSAYRAFLNHPPNRKISEGIEATLSDPRFAKEAAYRKQGLEALQEVIRAGEIPENWSRRILNKIHEDFPDRKLFIRSSTNAEDLEDFNGAGLYETVGNVVGDEAVLEAIKLVWASIWNFKAYEARTDAGISHRAVYPGILVQEAVQPFAAGVLVTKDVLAAQWNNRFYLNANPGFGFNTVNNGRGAPEQIYGDPFTGEVVRISISERGGALLTDTEVRQLVFFAAIIEQHFGQLRNKLPYPQDIEWLVVNGRVSIVQTRPYLELSR